jgi:hypothetical protein
VDRIVRLQGWREEGRPDNPYRGTTEHGRKSLRRGVSESLTVRDTSVLVEQTSREAGPNSKTHCVRDMGRFACQEGLVNERGRVC